MSFPTGIPVVPIVPGAVRGDMVGNANLTDVADAAEAFSNIKQAATTQASGVVELATAAETEAGTDETRAVTPAGVAAAVAAVVATETSGLAPLDSPAFTGTVTVPTVATSENSTRAASTAFVQTLLAATLQGVLELKGPLECALEPNYPAGVPGDTYFVTVGGRIGGAAGEVVEIGDMVICYLANNGGASAVVGSSWMIVQRNLLGALVAANNLSDLANPATARTNLGLGGTGITINGVTIALGGSATVASAIDNGSVTPAKLDRAYVVSGDADGLRRENGVGGFSSVSLGPDGALDIDATQETVFNGGALRTRVATLVAGGMLKITALGGSPAKGGFALATAGVDFPLMPAGHLSGFVLSNNGTDAVNDIDITAGTCADSTGVIMFNGAASTKRLDASWAAGSGNGGLFAGSVASNTWYHVFAIRKDSDGTVDYGFSTSLTASDKPAGYTYYRRLGSIRRDGSTIRPFRMVGDYVEYLTPTMDVEDTTLGTTRVTYSGTQASLPPFVTRAQLQVLWGHATVNTMVYVASPGSTDSAPSVSAAPLFTLRNNVAGSITGGQCMICTDASGQIAARASAAASTTTLRIAVLGYIDTRGK
ncbi:MAG: hypothetical protein EBR82_25415 [Caulobacteraceae bacterium]|nr:hypothetical protein [Caulobacteraceae bacterium]